MATAYVTFISMANQITEETRLRVRIGTAWGVLSAVAATAIWLTVLIVRIHFDNQNEHAKLMIGLEQLNQKSDEYVTIRQFEDATILMVQQLHTNLDYLQEFQIRERLRKTVRGIDNP